MVLELRKNQYIVHSVIFSTWKEIGAMLIYQYVYNKEMERVKMYYMASFY